MLNEAQRSEKRMAPQRHRARRDESFELGAVRASAVKDESGLDATGFIGSPV